jgi:DNA-binding transcriptional MerR regulator
MNTWFHQLNNPLMMKLQIPMLLTLLAFNANAEQSINDKITALTYSQEHDSAMEIAGSHQSLMEIIKMCQQHSPEHSAAIKKQLEIWEQHNQGVDDQIKQLMDELLWEKANGDPVQYNQQLSAKNQILNNARKALEQELLKFPGAMKGYCMNVPWLLSLDVFQLKDRLARLKE